MNHIPPPKPIRVMIVDDHNLVREGLRMLLVNKPEFHVVGSAENCAEALLLAECEQPEIILLDLDLGGENGLELLPRLLTVSKQSCVLVLTGIRDPEVHRKAMLLGAMGVLQKESAVEVLFKAIQKIRSGEIWYDRSKLGSILSEIRHGGGKKVDPDAERIATLSRREHDVIALVSQGLKNKEIGVRLFICETTVRHHLTSIFGKLQISSRLELIIFAFSQGLAVLPASGHYRGTGQSRGAASHSLVAAMPSEHLADRH